MRLFIYISTLILSSCSQSPPTVNVQEDLPASENPILYLKDHNSFDIYLQSDTLTFYLEVTNEEHSEYAYDMYSKNGSAKSGKFIYGVNFEDSDTLNLYFDCTSISLPKELCDKWTYFVKGTQSDFFYKE